MKPSRIPVHLLPPVHVFTAILIAAGIWLAPFFLPPIPSARAAPLDPGCHRECIQWEPGFNCRQDGSCKDRCVAFEVVCKDPGGGGGYAAPSITGSLYCAQPGENGWCAAGLSLDLSASDPQQLLVDISGNINGSAFACPDGDVECMVPIAMPGTGAAVYTVVSDSRLSASGSLTYKLDETPPQIAPGISAASGANGWHVSDVEVNAVITDATSGIASTTTLVDGSAVSLPDTLAADGEYTLLFNARDNAGNLSSQSYNVKIDQTPPVLNVSRNALPGDRGWYRSDVDYQITATDATSGLQTGEYRVDGGSWKIGMTFTVSGDGIHAVEYRVFDNAGNVASQSETIQIDATAPSTSFTAPSENTPVDKTVKVAGTSSDLTSGLNTVEVSVDDGASWVPVANGTWAYDWRVSELANGAHPVLVRARDLAGNVSSASNLPLLVDNVGPDISIADPWAFDEAGQLIVVPNAYGVSSVSITVTNSDGLVMASSEHTNDVPAIIWWDGRYMNEQQPAGEYVVSVTACDVHGVCATAKSAITIPDFHYTFPPTPMYPPPVVLTAPPIPAVVPTPALIEETPAPPVIVEARPPTTKRANSILPLFIFAGFGLLSFSNAVLDPRPRAMRSLAMTIRKNIKEYQR